MLLLSVTDVSIRIARERGTLRVEECQGRFGAYWAISDEHGLLTTTESAVEALRISGLGA